MTLSQQWTSLSGLAIKEWRRVFRIWVQTLVPSAITITLYFMIFGKIVGSRVGSVDGFSYMLYITPGLIMMPVITNSYTNVVGSFFGARFNRSIEEMLVSPMSNTSIIIGYMLGGVGRGLINGIIVTIVGSFLAGMHIQHPALTVLTVLLCSMMFSLMGFLNGAVARTFDDLSLIPTFILTPLIYLGGVFYNVNALPPIWRNISRLNPIHYIIELFRYAMLGVGGQSALWSLLVIILLTISLFGICLYCMEKGVGVKN